MPLLVSILSKSVITAAIMLLYYFAALRHKKLLRHSRLYLLLTVVISLAIPFMNFDLYTVSQESSPGVSNVLQVISSDGYEEAVSSAPIPSVSTEYIVLSIYTAVCCILLLLLCARIAWVYKIKRNSKTTHSGYYSIVHTQHPKAPFSFLNLIFWNDNIDMNSEAGNRILQHELAHVDQRHTLDKLFMEIIIALCWLNPMYWLIRHELAQVHEFLADESAIKDNDTTAFAEMLLTAHGKNTSSPVINPFYYSSVKNRLIMINKTTNTRFTKLRKAMMLPVLLVPVFLFSFRVHKTTPAPDNAGSRITLVLDAGHGGDDMGAVSKTHISEKALALRICRKMTELADNHNINVVLTRQGDKTLSLADRTLVASTIKHGVFVSVHVNQSAEDQPARKGYEVMIAANNPQSDQCKLLASAFMEQLSASGEPTIVIEKNLAVLRNNSLPAVVVECGDIDNAADMARMQDEQQLTEMCNHMLKSVVAYAQEVKK